MTINYNFNRVIVFLQRQSYFTYGDLESSGLKILATEGKLTTMILSKTSAKTAAKRGGSSTKKMGTNFCRCASYTCVKIANDSEMKI